MSSPPSATVRSEAAHSEAVPSSSEATPSSPSSTPAPTMAIKCLTLKLFIHKEKNEVVFVESDKDFVDILFSLLAMPIGNIIRLLGKKSGVGSLDTLYVSVEDLDTKYLQTEACKGMLLRPRRAFEPYYENLVLDIDDTRPKLLYSCPDWECLSQKSRAYTFMKNALCSCGRAMDQPLACSTSKDEGNGVFVMGSVMFLISDDLHVSPICAATLVDHLARHRIHDLSHLEERTAVFGKEELLNLLSRTLVSKRPLTDVFLPERNIVIDADEKIEFKGEDERKAGNDVCSAGFHKATIMLNVGSKETNTMVCTRADERFMCFPFRRFTSLLDPTKRPVSGSPSLGSRLDIKSKKVKVKLIGSRAQNKVIYAEAGEDFVDLLFSFLTFPLGSVVELLDGNSSVGCIDNLYGSVKELVTNFNRLVKPECKDLLLSPKIATHFSCGNQLLGLDEQPTMLAKCPYGNCVVLLREMNPKLANPGTGSGGGFVKGPGMFVVNEKMEVKIQSSLSALHVLSESGDFLNNFAERDVEMGKMEVLEVLKACLSARAPLNHVFPSLCGLR